VRREKMKTAIVYATLHGCTERCAQTLAAKLGGEVDRFDLKGRPRPDLSAYDRILVGGSIHAGRIQASVRRFCEANRQALLAKRLGLFLCCMEKGEKAREQFDRVFPGDLRSHAFASGLFGGGFDFERMNFIQKALIRRISGVKQTVMEIDDGAVARFAERMSGK
jgi:menaquinone-dependent protoporphyrinogen oxidase